MSSAQGLIQMQVHIWLRANRTTGPRNLRGTGVNCNLSMGHLCSIPIMLLHTSDHDPLKMRSSDRCFGVSRVGLCHWTIFENLSTRNT